VCEIDQSYLWLGGKEGGREGGRKGQGIVQEGEEGTCHEGLGGPQREEKSAVEARGTQRLIERELQEDRGPLALGEAAGEEEGGGREGGRGRDG